MLYPLKFTPILKTKIWGGQYLASKSTNSNVTDKIGESWEISSVEGDVSEVCEGALAENTLEELIEVYMGDLVGDKVYEQFGIEFPLLIKYIDANDALSIQVHPDDKTAMERHNAYGKTEMWYIADATKEASLTIGFNKAMDKAEYLEHLGNNTLPEILNVEHVEKGDAFYIPAGTIHAIGKGCVIAEIQETSDITYRIYDYNRKDDNGNLRELNNDLATDVIDFSYAPKHKITPHVHLNHTENVVKSPYFTTNVIEFDKEVEKDYFKIDSFVIYMCLEGEFTVVYDVDKSVHVSKGETVLVPAIFKDIFLIPKKQSKLLEIYID